MSPTLHPSFGHRRMPSLAGATEWLNSGPLTSDELEGRVVLVNFWTLTCINWLRQEPYVRAWSRVYRDDGLVVIGVHTPEFSFEHDIDEVRRATKEREIDYPVAVDNDYDIWRAFDNHYWPALYVVDVDGIVRHHHFGEGRYEQSERVIKRLLGVGHEPVVVDGLGVEAAADWDHLRTPETYLGYVRAERFAPPDGAAFDQNRGYTLTERLPPISGVLPANGRSDGRASCSNGPAAGSPTASTRDAHLVLASRTREPIPFRVLLDGEAPGSLHRVDVDEDGNGSQRNGRRYQLARQHETVRERPIEVTFLEPARGLRVHVRVADC